MSAFLVAVGVGVVSGIVVIAAGELTTRLLLRRKRLRFPYGIPRADYCIRCGIPHEPGKCRR